MAIWLYQINQKSTGMPSGGERSMGQVWIRCLESRPAIQHADEISRRYNTLEAAFSYDAIVNRLNKDFDISQEYRFYLRQVAKEARERMQKSFKRRICGPTDMDYLRMEQFGDMVSQLGFQLQRNIENADHPFQGR